MKQGIFLSFILFLSLLLPAQQKDKGIVISSGFHQTNSTGTFRTVSDEGVYPATQSPAVFFDVNVLFKKHGCPGFRLRPVSGVGVNQKGFVQKGLASDGSAALYEYTQTFKRTYVSLYWGLCYYFVYTKKIKADVGFLLNPELDARQILQNDSYFRRLALGSRSFVAMDYALNEKMAIRFSPYFQYGLSNYYKRLKSEWSSDYKPYGFGLNVGLVF
jgi:hypothetical protein